jgi:hypothetical protein
MTVLDFWDVSQCGGVAGLTSLEIEGAALCETSGYVNDKLNITAKKNTSITSNLIKQGG